MTEVNYYIGENGMHFMEFDVDGTFCKAAGADYKAALSSCMSYLQAFGLDPLDILLVGSAVEEDDDIVVLPEPGEMRHKLDAAYDLVDEVVADMRKMGWEGLAERTHRLYEGLYVDAIQTIEEEDVVRNTVRVG